MLSYRLQQVADCVNKCNVAADIGTDHGYIPIWLIKNNICNSAIAADISRGSCDKAENNININNLNDKIDVRCGNGLEVINWDTDKVDCIIISGMGGLLTLSVLNSNIKVLNNVSQLILQPQRDIDKVRKFILENGFKIVNEKILKENDKYYTVINAIKGKSEEYAEKELIFGKFLLEEKSPVLKEYVEIELNKIINAIKSLEDNLNPNNRVRYNELTNKYTIYKEVYECL